MTQAAPPATKRSRRKDQRPAEITAAALTLFARHGFAATRLDDVAREAGVSKGTVFLYFPTKEDLFRAVVRQELLPNIELFEAAVDGFAGPSADLLRFIAARFQVILESDLGAIPKLVMCESGNMPEIAQFYAEEVVERGIRLLDRVLQRGAARGEFRPVDARQVVPVFIGPVLMLLLWRQSLGRHSSAFDHRAVLEAHVEIFVRGIAAEPAP